MKITLFLIVTLCWVALATSTETVHHEDVAKHTGDSHQVDHHGTVKHVKKSGKNSKHDEESLSKGHSGAVHHVKDEAEENSKKAHSHEHSSHSDHELAGDGSHHGNELREGEKHRKAQSAKGFREQYHKNEHEKHDSFYSNGHKSGTWKNFGVKGSKYQSHKIDKDDHGKQIVLKSGEKHGKLSKKSSTHKSNDHKTHKLEKGKKSGHAKHEKWSKGSQQKSQNKHKYKHVPTAKI